MLKYPGGKNGSNGWVAREIMSLGSPDHYTEFRDACCGNAPFLWHLDYFPLDLPRWINDIDPWVHRYWIAFRDDPTFIDRVQELRGRTMGSFSEIYRTFCECRERLQAARDANDLSLFDAVDYAFVNRFAHKRICHRRRTTIATFAPHYIDEGLTPLRRERMADLRRILQGVRITDRDCLEVLRAPTDGIAFVLIDPPYVQGADMYATHWEEDDYVRLRDAVLSVNPATHRVLVTLDHSELSHYLWCETEGLWWTPRYQLSSMGDLGKNSRKAIRKEELVVTNFPLLDEVECLSS